MGRKPNIQFEEKLKAVKDYLSGKRSCTKICSDLSIYKSTFHYWVNKYQTLGKSGLGTSIRNISYLETVKLQAVTDYLNGLGSYQHICNIHDISSPSILLNWIKKYNSHEISKSHKVAEDKNMTNGRTAAYEQRVEIVAFCTENDYDYNLASKRFDVSYRQV